ncbi:hypothetical protein SAMN04515621_2138 [Erythrobacter sp. HL-111]|nr:hypothetical protein SAMN04515621_2138 [Erythrobacter sp. HL-111]
MTRAGITGAGITGTGMTGTGMTGAGMTGAGMNGLAFLPSFKSGANGRNRHRGAIGRMVRRRESGTARA